MDSEFKQIILEGFELVVYIPKMYNFIFVLQLILFILNPFYLDIKNCDFQEIIIVQDIYTLAYQASIECEYNQDEGSVVLTFQNGV